MLLEESVLDTCVSIRFQQTLKGDHLKIPKRRAFANEVLPRIRSNTRMGKGACFRNCRFPGLASAGVSA
jgi:hypothetical protein